MATRVDMPALGQSMEEGTITTWHKQEGDQVEKGELLYEVMTDKANIEQESPASGILRKILVPTDGIAPVKALIAIIADSDEDISALLGGETSEAVQAVEQMLSSASAAPATVAATNGGTATMTSAPVATALFVSPRARRKAEELQIEAQALAGRGTGPEGRIVEADVLAYQDLLVTQKKSQKVSPLAQRVAGTHGLDLAALAGSGSGHGGKVTSGDVHQALSPSSSPLPVGALLATPERAGAGEGPGVRAEDGPLRVIPLTGMRRIIAENVARSAATAPHVTLTMAVDMSEAARFRQQILPGIREIARCSYLLHGYYHEGDGAGAPRASDA